MTRLTTEIPSIRIGVVAHADYCDGPNNIIHMMDLTNDVNKLCNFVESVAAGGGGGTYANDVRTGTKRTAAGGRNRQGRGLAGPWG